MMKESLGSKIYWQYIRFCLKADFFDFLLCRYYNVRWFEYLKDKNGNPVGINTFFCYMKIPRFFTDIDLQISYRLSRLYGGSGSDISITGAIPTNFKRGKTLEKKIRDEKSNPFADYIAEKRTENLRKKIKSLKIEEEHT